MKNSLCVQAFQLALDILWAQVVIFSEQNMQQTNVKKYISHTMQDVFVVSASERAQRKSCNGADLDFGEWK